MSEKGKGSLLLPLGIGAGLLLLLTSMKKKEAAPVTATIPDDAAALLPQVSAEEAAVPQINPAQAPTYAQAQAKTAPANDPEAGEAEQEGEEDEADPQQSEENPEAESTDDEEGEDGSYSPSSGSRSGGGGNYTPYRPSSTINTNRQATPLPSGQQLPAVNSQTKWAVNPKSIRFQSDQAKMAALQKARNNKSLRFQSDQAKKFAQRSGANPLYVGNGKPRMGIPLPVTYRPGATAAVQQPIAITSQQAVTTPAATTAAKQTTIFPLRFGTTSSYVKEVQRRLGVSATGYFGTLTRTAIQKRFRVSEISEALYKQIITGKAPLVQPIRKPAAKAVRKVRKPLPKKINVIRRK